MVASLQSDWKIPMGGPNNDIRPDVSSLLVYFGFTASTSHSDVQSMLQSSNTKKLLLVCEHLFMITNRKWRKKPATWVYLLLLLLFCCIMVAGKLLLGALLPPSRSRD